MVHWRRGNFERRIEKDLFYFETDWVLGQKNIGEQLPNHVQGDNLRLKWTFCDKATFLAIRSYYPSLVSLPPLGGILKWKNTKIDGQLVLFKDILVRA